MNILQKSEGVFYKSFEALRSSNIERINVIALILCCCCSTYKLCTQHCAIGLVDIAQSITAYCSCVVYNRTIGILRVTVSSLVAVCGDSSA